MVKGSEGDVTRGPIVAALDVGGTTVTAAAITVDAVFVGPVHLDRSGADEPAEVIVDSLRRLIARCEVDAKQARSGLEAAALCFPGPFDYARGVSKMMHKFGALWGVNLRESLRAAADIESFFVNDADAAGHGIWVREAQDTERLAVVTLGTGIGLALLSAGEPSRYSEEPEDKEIWSESYRGGILEDYVSSRAITASYVESGGEAVSVREIADRARAGDGRAIDSFHEFGENLGAGLAEFLEDFAPDSIAITGNISKAWGLFGETAIAHFTAATAGTPKIWVADTVDAALIGGAHLYGSWRSRRANDRQDRLRF